MIEIERKFLVKSDDFKTNASKTSRIIQGFLNTDPHRTVRVRVKNNKGILTVKGLSSEDGLKRFEWEKEINKTEAKALLDFCEGSIIDKVRYEVNLGDHVFEIDEFYGDNEGLIIAEIELNHEDEYFSKPDWLGDEVTGNTKYYNSQLCLTPFKSW
ncbi:MAG: CYTH domain-containing protein [Bacteroidia bacterium]|nr:CYTH domain-containing protein [Bacteroidia bacterium]NND52654.1 CYTH domain-containing protein [Flavobacteriaceae bacterium]